MFEISLRCFKCGRKYSIGSFFWCPSCKGSLDVEYDYNEIEKIILTDEFKRTPVSHWKYWAFYPVNTPSKAVTLGEGNTPLIKSKMNSNLYFKYEGCNPTGSFKDRGSTVEITKALENNVKKALCATTGNMGASCSAYCAKAGIELTVYLPKDTPRSKIEQILSHGARVKKISGNYNDCLRKIHELKEKENYYLVGDYPFRTEGEKSIAFELAEKMKIDSVILPIGNGTLCYATYKGFQEFVYLGLYEKIPKIYGVQASGCAPVYKAWKENSEIKEINPKTKASAIAVGKPIDGEKAIFAVRKTGGKILAVSDKEISQAKAELAKEGIYAELGASTTYAAYKKLEDELKDQTCVLIITGTGLKEK